MVDSHYALTVLKKLLAINGPSKEENLVADFIISELNALGITSEQILFDNAFLKFNPPSRVGNLIVKLPGTVNLPRRLFSAHLDTVSLALNVNIAEREGRIYSSGSTALGGDDRTGVAALLTIIREIVVNRLSHPPLTFLFTISEESAPNGSQFVSPNDLENPVEGYNFDGADPIYLITGAIGIINFQVEVHGKATHAGVNPEGGISATLVAASALSALYEEGWCGAINQDGKSGSANVGLLCGALDGAVGGDVNVVTDYIKISGEARSYDLVFLERIALKYQEAFRLACKRIKNAQREEATFSFSHETVMVPFRLPEDAPVVKRASRLAEAIGIGKPHSKVIRGGLDANWFNALGIPTITLGAGQHEVHTLNEYIEISEFLNGCKLGLAIATDLN